MSFSFAVINCYLSASRRTSFI